MVDLINFSTANILGIEVAAINMDVVINICQQYIVRKRCLLLGVVNVAKLVNSRKDERLRASLEEADIVLADGQAIVWLSRLMGCALPQRVAGIDIMCRLLDQASKNHYSVFFLGARPEVVNRTVEVTKVRYPGAKIAGYRDGYFGDEIAKDVAEQIRQSAADILFVGISSPKKENFLHTWRSYMNVPVCHGVGGSFDVLAGITKRAPLWMQRCGMEWFYRLLQEPRRMWKRYLVTNTLFAALGLREILRCRFGIHKGVR